MSRAKNAIRALLGKRYQHYLTFKYRQKLKRQYDYDFERYAAAASNSWRALPKENLEAQIVLEYHRIEKGLALPQPKPFFGLDVVRNLVDMVNDFEGRFGSVLATERARAAIVSYVVAQEPDERLDFIPERFRSCDFEPATLEVPRSKLDRAAQIDFETFARSRHSLRHFTGAAVSFKMIHKAVSIAQTAPSVCNRQSGRVHAVTGETAIREALSFQNGNRGFGHLAGAIMIVTSDMRTFAHTYERNQCWIDGGLFAMMLQLGFHAQGLGTCMLNWSSDAGRDIAMRKAFDIPNHEAVITMMAVGPMPDDFRAAYSARPPVEQVLKVHSRTAKKSTDN